MKIDSFRDEYSFLSNFYEAPVEYEGLTYQSSEAAYQAQKCADPKDREAFTVMNPGKAKRAGRTVTLRKDWEDVKIAVMTDIVRAKFEQNSDLAEMLLATKDAYLEEGNYWGDRVWGTVNGEGANNLGIILMNTRKFLQTMHGGVDDKKLNDAIDCIHNFCKARKGRCIDCPAYITFRIESGDTVQTCKFRCDAPVN